MNAASLPIDPPNKAPLISIILPKKLLVLIEEIFDGAFLTPSSVDASAKSSDSFLLTADLLKIKREFLFSLTIEATFH